MADPGSAAPDRLGCTDCERIRDGRIAQPVNTVTSLAFVAAGGVVARRVPSRPHHRGQQLSYAALLALVGVGSAAFHGPQPPGSKQLHDWPIAGLLALSASIPVARVLRGRTAFPGASRRRGVALAAAALAAAASYAGGRTSAPTCDPDSLVQLHGLWHVLAAAGFLGVAEVLFDAAAVP